MKDAPPPDPNPIRDGLVRAVGGSIVAAILVFAIANVQQPPRWLLVFALTLTATIIIADMLGIGSNWPIRHLSPGRISLLSGCVLLSILLLAFDDTVIAYATATITTGFAETIFMSLAYRSRMNLVLQNIHEVLHAIESLLRHEHVALTATCLPFKRTSDGKLTLFLIQNPNFERWWLAPGAHCDHGGDGFAFPDEVAVSRCYEEAGLAVHLLEPLPSVFDDYEDCHPRRSPQFAFALDIKPTAKCSKRQHHAQHYDLTFVGEVIEVRNEFSLPRLLVTLDPRWGTREVADAINAAVRRWCSENKQPLGGVPYPPDFPARVAAGLKVFTSASRTAYTAHQSVFGEA